MDELRSFWHSHKSKVLIFSVLALLLFGFTWSTVKARGAGVDFPSYYYAAHTARSGGDLYTMHQDRRRLRLQPYLYPPFFATFMVPFSTPKLVAAYRFWSVFSLLLLFVALLLTHRIIRRMMPPAPVAPWQLIAVMLALSSFFVTVNMLTGQANILVLCLVCGVVYLYQRGRSLSAGALLAMVAVIKVLPAALALWFVVRRDIKALGAFILAIPVVALLIPALFSGCSWSWEMNAQWLSTFWQALVQGREGMPNYHSGGLNGSIVALFDRLFGGSGQRPLLTPLPQGTIDALSSILRSLILLSTTVVVIVAGWRKTQETHRWPLAASLILLAGLLTNILFWDHQAVILVLVLPIIGASAVRDPGDETSRTWLSIGGLAAVMALSSGFFPGSRNWAVQTVCFLVLWGCLARTLIVVPTRSEVSESHA